MKGEVTEIVVSKMVAKEKLAAPLNLDICNKKRGKKQLQAFEKNVLFVCMFWKDWENQPGNICIFVTMFFKCYIDLKD